MALVRCPECGETVADNAETCPHCGHPFQKNINKRTSQNGCAICLWIILALVAFYFIG